MERLMHFGWKPGQVPVSQNRIVFNNWLEWNDRRNQAWLDSYFILTAEGMKQNDAIFNSAKNTVVYLFH